MPKYRVVVLVEVESPSLYGAVQTVEVRLDRLNDPPGGGVPVHGEITKAEKVGA